MMIDLFTLAQDGIGGKGMFSPLLHAATGAFFAISGYHKLTNPARHAAILKTLVEDKVPMPKFNAWWVPGWELTAGLALMFGFFPAAAALVLAIICIVASYCEASKRVEAFEPVDEADRIDDYLYLPEVIYAIVLFAIVMGA